MVLAAAVVIAAATATQDDVVSNFPAYSRLDIPNPETSKKKEAQNREKPGTRILIFIQTTTMPALAHAPPAATQTTLEKHQHANAAHREVHATPKPP